MRITTETKLKLYQSFAATTAAASMYVCILSHRSTEIHDTFVESHKIETNFERAAQKKANNIATIQSLHASMLEATTTNEEKNTINTLFQGMYPHNRTAIASRERQKNILAKLHNIKEFLKENPTIANKAYECIPKYNQGITWRFNDPETNKTKQEKIILLTAYLAEKTKSTTEELIKIDKERKKANDNVNKKFNKIKEIIHPSMR